MKILLGEHVRRLKGPASWGGHQEGRQVSRGPWSGRRLRGDAFATGKRDSVLNPSAEKFPPMKTWRARGPPTYPAKTKSGFIVSSWIMLFFFPFLFFWTRGNFVPSCSNWQKNTEKFIKLQFDKLLHRVKFDSYLCWKNN